jgi:DNA-binding LacI/PurR family transcriptional regulator
MRDLLALDPHPTAVIGYNDLMAIGAMRAIRRAGLRVPDDVSLVGFDDVAIAAYVEPALTTLRQETVEMGRWAVTRLTEEIAQRAAAAGNGPSDGPPAGRPAVASHRIVPVQLEVRGTTGLAPRA